MPLIYHITRWDDWQAARAAGVYRAPSLDEQGFIHCSTAAQVARVANAIFPGQQGLALLCLDTDRLAAPLRFEPPVHPATGQPEPGAAELFPHLYGPLNLEAVVRVLDFPPGTDGTFTLPPDANDIAFQ